MPTAINRQDGIEHVKNGAFSQSVNAVVGPNEAKQARIPELDGLRGIAVLSVILYHYMGQIPGDAIFGLNYKFRQLFRLGWSGVDLFFVLSGFLIGGILLDARKSNSYFRTFYARRAFRILPIYFLWIALYVAAVGVFLRWPLHALPVSLETLKLIPRYLVFLPPVTGFPMLSLASYWLGPIWSLAVEEQFYLIAAPVVRFLSDRGLLITLVATMVLSPFIRILVRVIWASYPEVSFYLSFCRGDSIAAGMLIAMAWKNKPTRLFLLNRKREVYGTLLVASVPMVIFLKWLHSPEGFFTAAFGLGWIALFFSVLLITVLIDSQGRLASLIRWSFFREMGRISYCAYLIHFAVSNLLYEIVLKQQPNFNSVAGELLTVIALGLTIVLAEVSAKYIEGPMLRFGHRFHY